MPRLLNALSPALLLAAVLLVAACAPGPEGSRGTGAVLTSDGRFIANTDRNQRAEVCKHLANDLGAALGAGWEVIVTIDELPVWKPGMLEGDGDWRWQTATAQVAISGSGEPRLTPAEITSAVEHYLDQRAQTAVAVVTMGQTANVERQTAPASSVRTYTVQAGDTLADITTLFFGTPTKWRNIVAANPGMDPAALQPGRVLTIPAQPQ